jgi:hypothetical protein
MLNFQDDHRISVNDAAMSANPLGDYFPGHLIDLISDTRVKI